MVVQYITDGDITVAVSQVDRYRWLIVNMRVYLQSKEMSVDLVDPRSFASTHALL